MRRITTIAILTLTLCLLAGAALAAEVAQGRCIAYDTGAKTITIEEYDINFSKEHPYGVSTGVVATYDVREARIGLTPEPGDILRIAYELHSDKRIAVKVMNVTKQSLHGK